MHGAGFQGRAEIAQMLIDHGLDPSHRHTDGYTPIHRACWGDENRHTLMVRTLVKAGVPFDEKNSHGQTPLELTKNEGTRKYLAHRTKLALEKAEL